MFRKEKVDLDAPKHVVNKKLIRKFSPENVFMKKMRLFLHIMPLALIVAGWLMVMGMLSVCKLLKD